MVSMMDRMLLTPLPVPITMTRLGCLMVVALLLIVNGQQQAADRLQSASLFGRHPSSSVELSVLGVSRPICSSLPPEVRLSAAQNKLCSLYPDHMPIVGRGARLGLEECQWQFRAHRWNCSAAFYSKPSTISPSPVSQDTLDAAAAAAEIGSDDEPLNGSAVVDNDASTAALADLLNPSITTATVEAAFRHSILSAGVLYAVARACRDGELATCSCSTRSRPDGLDPEWVWGGCGDNTQYGYRFAVGFVDAREREKNYPRHSKQLARMLMNLHNNEAGRRSVYLYTKASCKCHGVSGSCSLRTCWNQLPPFRETGDRLRFRYERARQVAFNVHGTALQPVASDGGAGRRQSSSGSSTSSSRRSGRRPTREDLIFVDQSPDYCEADRSGTGVVTGAAGTRGRQCDRTSTATDGCGSLCCGRGYDTFRSRVTERCNCRFQWCCYVQCQTCRRTDNVYSCK